MKRFLISAVAVVTVIWAVPSFAVDAAFDAQYRVRAITVDNVKDFDGGKGGDNDSWIDQRFRLGITLKEATASGYVQMQMGGGGPNSSLVWGQNTAGSGSSYGSAENSFILRQAHLNFPVGPLAFKIGRSYASHGFLGGGMFENIADRYIISMKKSDDLTISLIHAKGREGSYTAPTSTANITTGAITTANGGIDSTNTNNDSDRNIYNLGFNCKLGEDKGDAAARVYYVRDGQFGYSAAGASTAGQFDAWWLTAQTNLKFTPANLYLSGAYMTGKSNPSGGSQLDVSGYAFHADLNANKGPAKVGVVTGIGSGDGDTTDSKLNTFFAPGGASYIQTAVFYQSGENAYSNSFIGTTNLNLQNGSLQTLSNVTWAGLYGDYKVLDDLTIGAKVAKFKKTEATSGTSKEIGNEINLTAKYNIHKGLSLLGLAAWFAPADGMTGGGGAKSDTISEYYTRLQWEI